MSLFDFVKKIGKQEEIEPLQPHQQDVLPECIEEFEEAHYKVLRRLKNHPVDEPFSGLMALEVDIPRFIPVLMDLGLIRVGTYEEALNALKNETLKEILSHFSLKTTGSKAVLIARIIDGIDEDDVRALDIYSDIYVHTEITKGVIDASYERFEREENDFFRECIDLIVSEDLNGAYRKICKRNAEKSVQPGLGCDWEKWYYQGIKPEQEAQYLENLHNSQDKLITAAVIYTNISGEGISSTQRKLSKNYHIQVDQSEFLRE